jgi:hypothetical protein
MNECLLIPEDEVIDILSTSCSMPDGRAAGQTSVSSTSDIAKEQVYRVMHCTAKNSALPFSSFPSSKDIQP